MIFEGADDLMLDVEEAERRVGWWIKAIIIAACLFLAAVVLGLSWTNARAQSSGALVNCSQTVGATAAPIVFPTSGAGPVAPDVYLRLCNAHASQTLGVNPLPGGTAAIGSAGTLTLAAGACLLFDRAPIPPAISVIGSGAGTTTACWYR